MILLLIGYLLIALCLTAFAWRYHKSKPLVLLVALCWPLLVLAGLVYELLVGPSRDPYEDRE